MVYGLSAALRGEITLKDGAVVQGNFDDYEPLRMSEMPRVEVHLVPSSAEPGGIGEPGLPPAAPGGRERAVRGDRQAAAGVTVAGAGVSRATRGTGWGSNRNALRALAALPAGRERSPHRRTT